MNGATDPDPGFVAVHCGRPFRQKIKNLKAFVPEERQEIVLLTPAKDYSTCRTCVRVGFLRHFTQSAHCVFDTDRLCHLLRSAVPGAATFSEVLRKC